MTEDVIISADEARTEFNGVTKYGSRPAADRGTQRWGSVYSAGEVVRIEDAKAANSQVGMNWMRGRLQQGDLAMVVSHAGDMFHEYVLLRVGLNFIEAVMGSRFGASMELGTAVDRLPEEDFVKLVSDQDHRLKYPFKNFEPATETIARLRAG